MIRDAEKDDAAEIAALLKPYVDKKILLHRSLEEIRENAAQTVVFAESGGILGTASLVFFSPTLCEIRALVIAESAQGRGIGKDLVLAAEAKALGLQNARPMRFFALTYTAEFFERCGYERTTKDQFPEKIYEVCNFCLRKDDCHEIAVQKQVS
ncbi:GNAT family N-acetyltransferase [Turneriella parva]|uniref:N-acetylglutamate synthase n=1 Tax=Turneriella parva (strain ATCC BAA-1111 / DSM 21527 / NCTC 11395 / H) TaxID=869212 RepID=I4B2E9_TURPD|nr:GNAT family N-acetyltransferase [Turneriella parva]AFM11456.1 N-acetylglutamate synthase [Turneriella parva DSM 21527]